MPAEYLVVFEYFLKEIQPLQNECPVTYHRIKLEFQALTHALK